MSNDNDSTNSTNISLTHREIVKRVSYWKELCPNFIVLIRFKATLTSMTIKCFAPRTNPAGVSFKTMETTDTLSVPMETGLSMLQRVLVVKGKTLADFERGNIQAGVHTTRRNSSSVNFTNTCSFWLSALVWMWVFADQMLMFPVGLCFIYMNASLNKADTNLIDTLVALFSYKSGKLYSTIQSTIRASLSFKTEHYIFFT